MKKLLYLIPIIILSSCYSEKAIVKHIDDKQKAQNVITLIVDKFPELTTMEYDTIEVPTIEYKDSLVYAVDTTTVDSLIRDAITNERLTLNQRVRLARERAVEAFIDDLADNGFYRQIDTNGVKFWFTFEKGTTGWILNRHLEVTPDKQVVPKEVIKVQPEKKVPLKENFWFWSTVFVTSLLIILFVRID